MIFQQIDETRDRGQVVEGLNRWLESRSGAYVAALSVALVGVVLSLDVLTGEDAFFTIFYLLPVSLAAWYGSQTIGTWVAALSGVAWSLGMDLPGLRDDPIGLVAVWNTVARVAFFMFIGYLLATVRKTLASESRLARIDPLTGAANARSFYEFCGLELAKSHRYERPLTLAYLDVDDFKRINDDLGHRAGDNVLKTIVGTLKETLRTSDVVARLGGDEFGVLLPETGSEAASIALLRVRERLTAALQPWGAATLSVGAATFVVLPNEVDDMVHTADDLMYSVKRDGKDAVRHEVLDRPREVKLDADLPHPSPR